LCGSRRPKIDIADGGDQYQVDVGCPGERLGKGRGRDDDEIQFLFML
jgi:hypothetical protein